MDTTQIVLDLTDEEIEKLQHEMIWCNDEGPPGEGWPSDAMASLRDKILAAVYSISKGTTTQ